MTMNASKGIVKKNNNRHSINVMGPLAVSQAREETVAVATT